MLLGLLRRTTTPVLTRQALLGSITSGPMLLGLLRRTTTPVLTRQALLGSRCLSSRTHALCLRPRTAVPSHTSSCLRRALCTHSKDPYKILGVPRSASDADIKRAYFKLAKENHPDLNKSPGASQRFREVAEAYDKLKSAESRRAYHGSGFPGAQQQQQRQQQPRWQQQQQRQRQPHWENDLFRRVWSELGMAEIDLYISRVQIEAGRALGLATTTGDTSLARQFAKDHRALLIGTIGPALLVLRVPSAAIWATRLVTPFLFLTRLGLPINLQWYLFSRMWVRAVLHMERAVKTIASDGGRSRGKPGAGRS